MILAKILHEKIYFQILLRRPFIHVVESRKMLAFRKRYENTIACTISDPVTYTRKRHSM